MPEDGHPVELVIRTASAVLMGKLAPQEAVTILATQVPQARSAAPRLAQIEPERADALAELLRELGRELREQLDSSPQPRHLRALLDDLAMVLRGFPST
jgi:hypothetical protein